MKQETAPVSVFPSSLRPVTVPPRPRTSTPTLRVPVAPAVSEPEELEELIASEGYESDDPEPLERLTADMGPLDDDLLTYFTRTRARRMGLPVGRDYPYTPPVEEEQPVASSDAEVPTQRRPRLSTFLAAVTAKV